MPTLSDLARAAVPYGLASVDLHRILVNFALDPSSPEFKAGLNAISHSRSLADPTDLSVVAMNVDTPYSYAWLDLRSGPVLLTMPAHAPGRYQSAQLFDLYTYIVGYVSPRTTGTGGGTYLISGPSSTAPELAVDGVFACPTDLCLVLVRTQLFDDTDLPEVAALQDAIGVKPVGPPSEPLRTVGPVDVRAPLDERFLKVLDWMLLLMPPLPADTALRTELALLGVGTGRVDEVVADPAARAEVLDGLAQGMRDVLERCRQVRSSAEIFGSRAFFDGDHLSRAAGAVLGILGNAAEEYLGVGYRADEDGDPFDGSHEYTITFGPHDLPPVDAFWSITVYDADQHLYANEIDRYVLGSRQVPTMVRDDDLALTIRVAHRNPGRNQANWLPCPAGPFGLTFRTYLPGPAIRDGSWTAPPVRRTT